MSVWITKKLRIAGWGAVQFRLIVLQQEMRSALHLAMLVRRSKVGQFDNVFILLPDQGLMDQFPGFIRVDESSLPEGLTLLVGPPSDFEKLFPAVAAKVIATRLGDVDEREVPIAPDAT
jgi:hypothetical protein